MGFEGPSQQTSTQESVEKPVYRISELESQIAGFEGQKNQAREAMKKREITMDTYGGKLGEIDKNIAAIQAQLSEEKGRVSPEDRELLEMLNQEKESLKFQMTGFNSLLNRYRSMQDFKGNPRPDVNADEYRQLTQELSLAQSDFRNRRGELTKKMEDLVSRGLISKSEITKLPSL